MSKLRRLATLVRVTRASILVIERFVDAFSIETDCEKVPFRIQRLDDLYNRHTAALVDLEQSTDDSSTLDEYAKERVDMEDRYNKLRDFLLSHTPTARGSASVLCTSPVLIPNCCSVCSQPHRTSVCTLYLRLPYDQKFEAVLQMNLWQNCLSFSHTTRDCSSRPCWRCNQKHHLSLHPPSPDDHPLATRSRTIAELQQSIKATILPSPTLTQEKALTITPTLDHNNSQPAVLWELVSPSTASDTSPSEAVKLNAGSALPAKITADLDVISLQGVTPTTDAQLRHSLRCDLLFTHGSPPDHLLRIQYTAGAVLSEPRKTGLQALSTADKLDQQLPLDPKLKASLQIRETVLPAQSTVKTLAHSCSLESEVTRFKLSAPPKKGLLEDTIAPRKHARNVGVSPPDFTKLKLSCPERYLSLTSSTHIGVSCNAFTEPCPLDQPGDPAAPSACLWAKDLSQTRNVEQIQCCLKVQTLIRNGKMVELQKFWFSVDPFVDRSALPVGGRRGQLTNTWKQKLILLVNRSPHKLILDSAHRPLLLASPQLKLRNMATQRTWYSAVVTPVAINHDWQPKNLSGHCSTRWNSRLDPGLNCTQQTSGPSKGANELERRFHCYTWRVALQTHMHEPHPGDQPSFSSDIEGHPGADVVVSLPDELLNESAAQSSDKEG